MGFTTKASPIAFEIKQWGFVDNHLVLALVQLWKALGSSGTSICQDVEELAKTAYEMVIGERESFEVVYGWDYRPDFSNWGHKSALEPYAEDSVARIMIHMYCKINGIPYACESCR